MTRKTPRERVDRFKAASYCGVGGEFFKAADLAGGHGYWNASGLLLVHASIAYADAVSIALLGAKTTSDNHMDAVKLLGEAAARIEHREQAMNHLFKIIDEKNRASYTGQSFRAADVERLRLHATRFQTWAKAILSS